MLINLFVFLFGLAIGSFLNCLIYRLEKKKGFLKGRSYCPHCKHTLSWQDLIPVFSFLILKGKCRYCKKKISLQYPLIELATGLLFLSIFIYFNDLFFIYFLFLISSFLIIVFVYDLKHYLIPDRIIYPAIIIALIYRLIGIYYLPTSIYGFLFSAFGGAGFFLLIVLISRGKWMGIGDIKLAFLIGLLLGYPNTLLGLFLAFLIGAIIGLGLIGLRKKTIKSELPFGPFLVIGTYLALFFGEKIINWYFNLFFV
jgi:prepilin signal peptidase PulO-like enzyme (type II secretory pathway)